MTDRLSNETLNRAASGVRRPGYDRASLRPRMVHLGVGAFHRAHQAVYTDDAIEAHGGGSGGGDWGVTGVSLRSTTAEDQLGPQDGLFGVTTRSGEAESTRVVGNLTRMITAPKDPAGARAALADPEVAVVTLTITEKGYGLDPATGDLLTEIGDVAADLANPREPRSAIGYLAEALRARREAGAPPFTVVSCDNLPSNGARVASALRQYAERLDEDLARWIETEIACPETMVDRIVPATTEGILARAEVALGLRDEGHVVTEPFMQWVIEDRFCGPRPAWDRAGAMLVPEVAPYETAKLRLLNGPHSAIAYLGYLSGHRYVHEVMADDALARFVGRLMDEEIAPTVAEPDGMSLSGYADDLRERFRNPALQHRTWQIAMDGSQKLPQRLLNTIRDRRDAGASYDRLALAVAAWMTYATGAGPNGEAIDVRDPLAERTAEIGRRADGDADALLAGYLSLAEVFGDDLPADEAFRRTVGSRLRRVLTDGPRVAAEALV